MSLRAAMLSMLGASLALLVAAACSSSSSSSGPTGGGDGGDAGGDGAIEFGDGGICIQACLEAHPKAADKLGAVDDCVQTKCEQPCNQELDSDGGPDAGLCGTPIVSGSPKACDDCITASCCAEWAGCFGDKDCLAFNDCLSACPSN